MCIPLSTLLLYIIVGQCPSSSAIRRGFISSFRTRQRVQKAGAWDLGLTLEHVAQSVATTMLARTRSSLPCRLILIRQRRLWRFCDVKARWKRRLHFVSALDHLYTVLAWILFLIALYSVSSYLLSKVVSCAPRELLLIPSWHSLFYLGTFIHVVCTGQYLVLMGSQCATVLTSSHYRRMQYNKRKPQTITSPDT